METRQLTSNRDRRNYAVGTAIVGVLIGWMMILGRTFESAWGSAIVAGLFIGGVLAAHGWVERNIRAAPRHAKRWAGIAVGLSMLVGLVGALPIINYREQTEPASGLMQFLAIGAVALPSWVIAVWMSKERP